MPFLPENISTFGFELDNLATLITWITMICLAIAEIVLFYFLIRFRRKKDTKATYIKGNNWHQLKWIMIPLVIVVGLDLFIDEKNTHAWNRIKIDIPEKEHYEFVRITGQQFSWAFTYPGEDKKLGTNDDFKTVNELHIPINETIIYYLEAKDVLHSFSIPAMRFKQDALPGRTIKGWFDAIKAGEYEIQCTEICGTGHSLMAAKLIVHTPEEYKTWVQKEISKVKVKHPMSTESSGSNQIKSEGLAVLNSKGCLGCHSTDGSKLVGPTYKGIFGRKTVVSVNGHDKEIIVDNAYLKRAINEPKAEIVKGYAPVMPKSTLSDVEIEQIINYLKELK